MTTVNAATAGDHLRTSYRALRLSIVVMILALGVSLAIERGRATCLQGSISSYYYTPVHSVFVGALIALGVVMIALKGRDPIEDQLFNIAGVLATIVALVPTSRPGGAAGTPSGICSRADEVVEISSRGLIINNIPALVAAVLAAIVLTIVVVRRAHLDTNTVPPATRAGLTVSVALLVVGAVWYWFWNASFLRWAHGGGAIAMFVVIWLAVLVNAGWPASLWRGVARRLGAPVPNPPATPEERDRRLRYRRWYRAIAVAMPAVALLAVLVVPNAHRVFWLEVAEIIPFAAFWLVQTFDGWNTGLAAPTAAV